MNEMILFGFFFVLSVGRRRTESNPVPGVWTVSVLWIKITKTNKKIQKKTSLIFQKKNKRFTL